MLFPSNLSFETHGAHEPALRLGSEGATRGSTPTLDTKINEALYMPRENNIFHNLVVCENDCTELFCNLLSIKVFRDAVLDLFGCGHIKSQTSSADFFTQASSVGGRPDIEVLGDGYKILIEVKTNAHTSLTTYQKAGYADIFAESNESWRQLVFIAPSDYAHLQVINEMVRPALEKQNPSVKVSFVSWESIIELIEQNELDILSPFLNQFAGLLRGWFVLPSISFSYGDIKMLYSADTAKALKKLREVVDHVEAASKGFATYTYRPKDQSEYGVTFRDGDGNDLLFFGIWYDFWEEHGFPLCLAVGDDWSSPVAKTLENQRFANKVISFAGWKVLPLPEELLASDSVPSAVWGVISQLLKTSDE